MDDDTSDSESWEELPFPRSYPQYRILLAIRNLIRQVRDDSDDEPDNPPNDTAAFDGFESGSQTSVSVTDATTSATDTTTSDDITEDSEGTMEGSQNLSDSSSNTIQYQPDNSESMASIHSNDEPSTLVIDDQHESSDPLFPDEEVETIPHSTTPIKKSPKRKRENSTSPETKRKKSNDDEDGTLCPICFDNWTSDGEHRLCALKCGHLFGHICIKKWFSNDNAPRKSCPTCKAKTNLKDIRFLYAKKLIMTDTSELDALKKKLSDSVAEKRQLMLKLDRLKEEFETQKKLMLERENEFRRLQTAYIESRPSKPFNVSAPNRHEFKLVKTLQMSKDKSCRVMAYHSTGLLVVSVASPHPVFPGYGIIKVKLRDNCNCELYNPLHSEVIRDLAFHPQTAELLLSASLDKTAKIMNVLTNAILHTVRTEAPLWSCCWDQNDPNIFYVGTQRGCVIQFSRDSSEPLKTFSILETSTPVHSLISTTPYPKATTGSLICGSLQVCCVFEFNDNEINTKRILLEGPFVSLNYNRLKKQFLISTRANSKNVCCRNIFCELEECDEAEDELKLKQIHCFQGGTHQSLLTRNCQIPLTNCNGDVLEVLVAIYQESKKQVEIYSVSSGALVYSIDIKEPVRDTCFIAEMKLFVILSDCRVRVYRIKPFSK